MADSKLELLIDVRSRLDELTKATAELSKFRQEATSTGQALKTGFGIEIARRGLDLLTRSLREMAVESFNMADAIKDTARNLGLTTDAYQVLGAIIKDAGGDIGLLTMAVSNSNRSLAEARNVGSAAASAYRALGLNIVALEQLPIERRFETIARAIANSTDRTAAFDAASKILGARNLPTLLGALRDLAEEGYDKVAAAAREAGRVMENETIQRLERAKKNIEKLKEAATITVGEEVGTIMGAWEKEGIMGVMRYAAAAWQPFYRAAVKARYAAAVPETPPPPGDGSAEREAALKNQLAAAEDALARAILRRQTIEADPTRTDLQKRERLVALMKDEAAARTAVADALKAMPLDGTTQQQRDFEIEKLREENKRLNDQLRRIGYGTPSFDREQSTRDRYKQFTEDDNGLGGFNAGGAMRLGAMDWVTSLGTQGEQVSAALQSTLGATVQGISDGIYGWITGTMSFGEAMMQLGATVLRTILQTIVQMGVQMLVNATLGKALQAAAHAAAVGMALAVAAPLAMIWAVPATLATIATMGAAAAQAPMSITAAKGTVLATSVAGFSEGGYTGDFPESQVAGVVHGREGVLNAPAMRALGISRLDQLNAGVPLEQLAVPSFSRASAVVAGAPLLGGRGAGMGGGGRESGRNVYVYLDRGAWLDAVQGDLRGIAVEEYGRQQRA